LKSFNESLSSIAYKNPDLIFIKPLSNRFYKLHYKSADLIFYSLYKPKDEKEYLSAVKSKLDEEKLKEMIKKEKLNSAFDDFLFKNRFEYRIKTPIRLFLGNSRYHRIGFFYETTNNKDKLIANKEFGVTITRDLADSIFTISLGSHADITPRKFFYKEIDKFNILNPDRKIDIEKLNKFSYSLNLEYYALFNLYKNDRGIFGLKTKIFTNSLYNDAAKLALTTFISRQLKDKLDLAIKFKIRGLKAPKPNAEQLNYFKSLVKIIVLYFFYRMSLRIWMN